MSKGLATKCSTLGARREFSGNWPSCTRQGTPSLLYPGRSQQSYSIRSQQEGLPYKFGWPRWSNISRLLKGTRTSTLFAFIHFCETPEVCDMKMALMPSQPSQITDTLRAEVAKPY